MFASVVEPHFDLSLVPVRDVIVCEGAFLASSSDPWLRASVPLRPGKTYEIVYGCGAGQEVVRPLLRFILADGGHREVHMPAACEGLGIWRGRIPAGTVEAWISPVARAGFFTFALESVRRMTIADRFSFMAASPKRAFFAASARFVGLEAEADLNLKWVYGRAETQDFSRWQARRSSIEAPVARDERPFTVFLHGLEPAKSLARSVASLRGQTHQTWRLCVLSPTPEQAAWLAKQNDKRITSSFGAALRDEHDGFVTFLAPGDELAAHAFSCVQAHFERQSTDRIAYCDEIRIERNGRRAPVFKPDWSPVRQAFAPYVGRAAFARAQVSAQRGLPAGKPEDWVNSILESCDLESVGHIRRPLLSINRTVVAPAPRYRIWQKKSDLSPAIGIVVPTRDRLDLLAPCLESILGQTTYPNYKIVVVDNDSAEPRTTEWLEKMQRQEPRLSVVHHAGAFNFSALCNFGAASVQSEFLLFLNNDTEVLQADWLDNLLRFASAPDIGAVGAKLLYPSNRIQHAGIVLGLGGVAGHFGEGSSPNCAGWLGSSEFPHEVSAVTGACLLISSEKFHAVGGFDAINLPVDLNDVDLCLRLAERGWRTICDCQTKLLHRQSASRGSGALRLQRVYERERSYFVNRWRSRIRDDGFFNPNLSLFYQVAALG